MDTSFCAAGDQARDAGNTAEAADKYQRSLKLKADNPAVIYAAYQCLPGHGSGRSGQKGTLGAADHEFPGYRRSSVGENSQRILRIG